MLYIPERNINIWHARRITGLLGNERDALLWRLVLLKTGVHEW